MGSFERMFSGLPEVLQTESIKKLYMSLGNIFDKLQAEREEYIYTDVMSELHSDMLDLYGKSYLVSRDGMKDEGYKNKIITERAKTNFIPLLDSYIDIIKNITGYEVEVTEGWALPIPKKALLSLVITIPPGSDQTLLFDLDSLYSCGVKTVWEVRQASYIPYELIGTHNDTGLRKLTKFKDKIFDQNNRRSKAWEK